MTSKEKIQTIISNKSEQIGLILNPFWKKNKTEISRKAIHIISILIPLMYWLVFDYNKKLIILILFGMTTVMIVAELLRLQKKKFSKYFHLFFGIILRKHEDNDFTGATYLLTSAMVCIAFFPPEIAFLAMSFLSIGDTFAALVGMNFGRRKFKNSNKSVEGFLACLVTTFSYGFIMLHLGIIKNPTEPHYWYPIVLLGAMAASIAEVVNIRVDDNVKIPIISGVAMYMTYYIVMLFAPIHHLSG